MAAVALPVVPIEPRALYTPRAGEQRIGDRVQCMTDARRCPRGAVVLLGVPEDRGVAVHRGRSGAAAGPEALRRSLYRLAGAFELWDAGDVKRGETNRETHVNVRETIRALGQAGAFPIMIGGSHDNSYGGVAGCAATQRGCAVINIDAHLDLRAPEPSGHVNSGTPFRRLIDERIIPGSSLVEFGYQPHVNDASLLIWAKQQGVRLWSWAEVQTPSPVQVFAQLVQDLGRMHEGIALSLDLDVIPASEAPGVSAPATFGFRATEVLAMLQLAAQEPRLCYLDVMELNPTHDVDGRTARLAASLIWHFVVERGQGVVHP